MLEGVVNEGGDFRLSFFVNQPIVVLFLCINLLEFNFLEGNTNIGSTCLLDHILSILVLGFCASVIDVHPLPVGVITDILILCRLLIDLGFHSVLTLHYLGLNVLLCNLLHLLRRGSFFGSECFIVCSRLG